MKPNPINTLALWLPMNTDELSIKAFSPGYPYLDGSIVRRSDLANPVTRYAKNYTTGKKKYSLCVISTEPDIKKIEAWLDEQSKKIKPKDIQDKFVLLDIHYAK